MKGVSAVIAIILILMITVALAAMAYVWFTSVFQQLTTSSGSAATATAAALGTSFTIESAAYTSGNQIKVSIRNTGSESIDLSGMAFYMDDLPAEVTTSGTSASGSSTLGSGEVTNSTGLFVIANTTDIGAICPGPTALRATVPVGYTQTVTITCP